MTFPENKSIFSGAVWTGTSTPRPGATWRTSANRLRWVHARANPFRLEIKEKGNITQTHARPSVCQYVSPPSVCVSSRSACCHSSWSTSTSSTCWRSCCSTSPPNASPCPPSCDTPSSCSRSSSSRWPGAECGGAAVKCSDDPQWLAWLVCQVPNVGGTFQVRDRFLLKGGGRVIISTAITSLCDGLNSLIIPEGTNPLIKFAAPVVLTGRRKMARNFGWNVADEEEGHWTDGSGYPFKVGTNKKLWKKNYLHFVFPWGNNSKF